MVGLSPGFDHILYLRLFYFWDFHGDLPAPAVNVSLGTHNVGKALPICARNMCGEDGSSRSS